jgi:hypothetical protein
MFGAKAPVTVLVWVLSPGAGAANATPGSRLAIAPDAKTPPARNKPRLLNSPLDMCTSAEINLRGRYADLGGHS